MKVIKNETEVRALVSTILDSADKTREKLQNMSAEDFLLLAYRKYQREHETDILSPGIAFPFVRRFLELNTVSSERQPVEFVLLSRRAEVHAIGSHSVRYCNTKQTEGD